MARKKHGGRLRRSSQPAPQPPLRQQKQTRPGPVNMRGINRGSAIFKVALAESQEIVAAILRSLEGRSMPELGAFVSSVACSAYAAGLTNGIVLGLTQGDMSQDMINQELTGPEQLEAALMAQNFTRDYRDEVPHEGPRSTSVPVRPEPESADNAPLDRRDGDEPPAATGSVDAAEPKPKRATRPRTRRPAGVASPEPGAVEPAEVS